MDFSKITRQEIAGQAKDLCDQCLAQDECKLLNLKQATHEAFIGRVEDLEKRKDKPEADLEGIEESTAGAILEMGFLKAQLRTSGRKVDCPYGKEF